MRTIGYLGVKLTGIAVAAALLLGSTAFAQARTSTANFSQGETVQVAATVNVRSSAGGSVIGHESRGSTGTLVGGPSNANGYTWWQISYADGTAGWTAEDFLQSASVALQGPSTNVVAIATNESGKSGTNTNDALTANASGAASSNPAIQSLIASLRAQLNSILAQIATIKAGQ